MMDYRGAASQLASMGRNRGPLNAQRRNALPTTAFALPQQRAYPINDPNHARNALARAAQNATPEQQAQIRAAVQRRYPGIGQQ